MRKSLPLLVAAIVIGLGGGLVATNGATASPAPAQPAVTTGNAASATPMGSSGGSCC
jgi:hypothetical protein